MFFLKTVTFFALLVSQFPVMAQGLELESGGVSVEYDTIDISGEYSNRKPRPLTPSEKLKIYRGKMVQRNHMIMEKKLETMRIKAEGNKNGGPLIH